MSRVTPFVPVEVVKGRLVRVCPACGLEIGERTDEDGVVSKNFAAHYETEHGLEEEPSRQHAYLLGSSERFAAGDGVILDSVRKQMPHLDWQLVRQVDDLPEGAVVLLAHQVLLGMWAKGDNDPHVKQVRLYRRRGDHLVFTPTQAQHEERDAAMARAAHLRRVFIHRYHDELPKLRARTSAGVDRHLKRQREIEDELASEFDSRRAAASSQFLRGESSWLKTLNAAIDDLGIADEEIEQYEAYEESRRAESMAFLIARIDDPQTPIEESDFLRELLEEQFGVGRIPSGL